MAGNDETRDRQRDERLAAALRENLKRRKTQKRELTDVEEDQP